MHPEHNRTILCTCITLLAAALGAQQPSNWTTITAPATASAPNSIGTTVSFLTSSSVWLYSGITKVWTVLPVATPAPIFQANDYCIIQDGNRIHGYASHTGKVDTITVTGTPTIVSGPASSAWVTLVADGNIAWGFGAFHGKWESVTLAQPNPTVVSNRLIGMLRDGSTVYGLNAHYGTFVPVSADAAATLSVIGEAEVGTAHSPGVFRAFSAQHNNWGVQVVPATATTLQQNEYAMAWSGNQIWAFSGMSGTLDTYTASSAITGVTGAEGVAAFVDGPNAVCYGSGRGRFVARAAASPTFHFDYHLAVLVESGLLTPFSAITGSYGPPIPGTYTLSSNDAIAYADSGTSGFAYSPILNRWTASPTGLGAATIALVRDSVVLAHAAGYAALSARHGTWMPLSTGLIGNFMAPNTGSTFVALDGAGDTAHVFDARLNRWATTVALAPLTVRISRHTVMAHDGLFAYGFGQPSSEWYREPLTTAPSRFDTASSIGSVAHGTQLSVYSVQGSLCYTGRFPEFTQAINLGNTLTLHQVAPPGSAMVLLVGARPAYIDLGPSLGRLYLDPTLVLTLPWPGVVGPSGIRDLTMTVPNDPSLVGSQPQFQDVVVPPSGTPWLSSSVAPVLF